MALRATIGAATSTKRQTPNTSQHAQSKPAALCTTAALRDSDILYMSDQPYNRPSRTNTLVPTLHTLAYVYGGDTDRGEWITQQTRSDRPEAQSKTLKMSHTLGGKQCACLSLQLREIQTNSSCMYVVYYEPCPKAVRQ